MPPGSGRFSRLLLIRLERCIDRIAGRRGVTHRTGLTNPVDQIQGIGRIEDGATVGRSGVVDLALLSRLVRSIDLSHGLLIRSHGKNAGKGEAADRESAEHGDEA